MMLYAIWCYVRPSYNGTHLGWGLLKLCSLISLLGLFLNSKTCLLYPVNHIHIWQVSPQLSCGSTCQTWMWFQIGNQCFRVIEKLINYWKGENWFSNPHPCTWDSSRSVWSYTCSNKSLHHKRPFCDISACHRYHHSLGLSSKGNHTSQNTISIWHQAHGCGVERLCMGVMTSLKLGTNTYHSKKMCLEWTKESMGCWPPVKHGLLTEYETIH